MLLDSVNELNFIQAVIIIGVLGCDLSEHCVSRTISSCQIRNSGVKSGRLIALLDMTFHGKFLKRKLIRIT
jgi:hypothetical protein